MDVRSHRGFTLIELLVAMTVAILLLLLAVPGYVRWIADSEISNGAQSIVSGLRYAQDIAIARNRNAQFVLGANGWTVAMVDTPLVPLQTASFNEGSKSAVFTGIDATSAAATTIAFNGLGQVIANAANLVRVDVKAPTVAGSRPLRVQVGNAGALTTAGTFGIKLCDPAWVWPDPKGCPP